ncbi:nuclear transport factor 2-like protein [Microbulbifer hainanensis]|uniref:hypothetical protein n=1 Tax=Microbulbifer hainanensis TaxID=2735675 RepID=UPI001868A73A|nr:hypothetical protein [Microbulbifer hainanensis]
MVEIFGSRDCGNSPKNKFIEKIGIALEVGDPEFFGEVLSEGVVWELDDGSVAEGEYISRRIKQIKNGITSINIDHVTSHGKVGSINGYVRDRKGKKTHFCHVIEFTSVKCSKINRVCSYGKS